MKALQECQIGVPGKISGVFYSSSPLRLFEFTTSVLKTGLKARNRGLLFESRKSGREEERQPRQS